MKFTLLPTLDIMIDFYSLPLNQDRFTRYLELLQGGRKDSLHLPLVGYNPMAKDHILTKLYELRSLNIESLMSEVINSINATIINDEDIEFKVAFNLSDDLHGGWTNRHTTDYDSKFNFQGLFNKKFSVPLFWATDAITAEVIHDTTLEYIYRTIYWATYIKPTSLTQFLDQEIFVAKKIKSISCHQESDFDSLKIFYDQYQHTDNYSIIFNFFYGDHTSSLLSYPTYGIDPNATGYDYARFVNME
jgi:hypothetical protein